MGKERERETSQGKIGDKDLRRCARSSAVREMHGGMVEGEAERPWSKGPGGSKSQNEALHRPEPQFPHL